MEAAGTVESSSEVTCAVLGRDPLPAGSVHRFLVGKDQGPQPMSEDEMARELNDPFATLLLRQGRFPATGEGVFQALDEAVGPDHPLSKGTERSFLVGEGSQIAKDPSKAFDRRFRFIVTRGVGTDGPELLLSAGHPTRGGQVEVTAWDASQGGFNYYRTARGGEGDVGAWVWAGNSRHAFDSDMRDKGPFESHPSGNILMKELKIPWVHWASPKATVDGRDFHSDDDRPGHPWFEHEGAGPPPCLPRPDERPRPARREGRAPACFAIIPRSASPNSRPVSRRAVTPRRRASPRSRPRCTVSIWGSEPGIPLADHGPVLWRDEHSLRRPRFPVGAG